jgi:hypothetical protein
LGFAFGALLLSMMLTAVTDVVSARYLIDQRERIAARQAVINGLFVEGQVAREGEELSTALEAARLGSGTNAVITSPSGSSWSACRCRTATGTTRSALWRTSTPRSAPSRGPASLRRC